MSYGRPRLTRAQETVAELTTGEWKSTAGPFLHFEGVQTSGFIRLYAILYYTILYYTILYYTKLYYTILYYTILYYTILYYTILYYTILYYTILYSTLICVRRQRRATVPTLCVAGCSTSQLRLAPHFCTALEDGARASTRKP